MLTLSAILLAASAGSLAVAAAFCTPHRTGTERAQNRLVGIGSDVAVVRVSHLSAVLVEIGDVLWFSLTRLFCVCSVGVLWGVLYICKFREPVRTGCSVRSVLRPGLRLTRTYVHACTLRVSAPYASEARRSGGTERQNAGIAVRQAGCATIKTHGRMVVHAGPTTRGESHGGNR